MEGDDFVNTAVSLKEKNENTVGRNTAIKERFDELNKINDTWMNSLNNCWKPCTWYSLLRGYDDSQLKSICGSDGALYIVYLRYSAYFFTLMSMGNGVLIYIYVTGDNKNLPNVMQSFTISAISGEVDEEYLVFVYAIIGITCLSVLFIISYMGKFSDDPDFMALQGSSENNEVKLEDSILSDIQIQLRTVQIKGLDKDMKPEWAND